MVVTEVKVDCSICVARLASKLILTIITFQEEKKCSLCTQEKEDEAASFKGGWGNQLTLWVSLMLFNLWVTFFFFFFVSP